MGVNNPNEWTAAMEFMTGAFLVSGFIILILWVPLRKMERWLMKKLDDKEGD